MLRSLVLLGAVTIAAGLPARAQAQADAQQAYRKAKTAYEAGQWAEARDLARDASQTDANNPEVWLLLGRARYQLGQIHEALDAWQRTLRLAPEEPYARRMIETLRAQRTEVDVQTRLAESLLVEGLFGEAWEVAKRLLADKGLSEAQRVRLLMLRAELDLRTGKADSARKTLEELLVLYPDRIDAVQVTLLLGRAKLQGDQRLVAEGVAALEKLVGEHPKTEAAASAQYALLNFHLSQGVTAAQVDALRQWIAANPKHREIHEARRSLLGHGLTLAASAGRPEPDAPLSEQDAANLALAAELLKPPQREATAVKIADDVLKHLETYYAANGAHAAAATGADSLLQAASRLPVRERALRALARHRATAVLGQLVDELRAGKSAAAAPFAPLPKPLANVVATCERINEELPFRPAWNELADLAKRVRGLAGLVPVPPRAGQLRAPDSWAATIAMGVVRSSAEAKTIGQAAELVLAVATELARTDAASHRAALAVDKALVDALDKDHPVWTKAAATYCTHLKDHASYVFQENIKEGRAAENASLSEPQKALLEAIRTRLAWDKSYAAEALKLLAALARPLVEHGHWAAAEEVYAGTLPALPEPQRLQGELAVVNLWIDQVARRDQRLVGAGLTVPEQLDETMKRAVLKLRALHAGLDEGRPELSTIRAAWSRVAAHYVGLEYEEVALEALQTLPKDAAPGKPALAEAYAAFQRVRLHEEQARRELDRLLEQYGGKERIELSPAFRKVIDGYLEFCRANPFDKKPPEIHPFADEALSAVLAVGRRFEALGAHQVAADIYRDAAKTCAGTKAFTQSRPHQLSKAQQAALAWADALAAAGRKALADSTAQRKPGDPPPGEIHKEFADAIAAYLSLIDPKPQAPVIEPDPKGPLAGPVIGRVMGVALEYAKVDAWEVAEGVYADLLAARLSLRRPERLEFARGLCKLGQVMPDHARKILTSLGKAGLREPTGPVEVADLAMDSTVVGERSSQSEAPRSASKPQATAPGAEQPAASMPAQPDVGGGNELGMTTLDGRAQAQRDTQLLAMIRQQEASRAAQVAQLREGAYRYAANAPVQQMEQQQGQAQGQQAPAPPVLSAAEIARQEEALGEAYPIFQAIRAEHSHTVTAEQARGEILVMVAHWRGVAQWERAAHLALKYLKDNPKDREQIKLRLEIARDLLAWASKPIARQPSKQAMLDEVSKRFADARHKLEEIARIARPEERSRAQAAQWEIAQSFLTQARVVNAFSPTLARGQYVRAVKELSRVADRYPDHPQIGQIPQMMWSIAQELEGRGYWDEAILVWNELSIHHPMSSLADQATLKVAQTYHQRLRRPMKAAEVYQELNFARGGNDQGVQNLIYQIGNELKNEKRWVEALHVLETFVDSFPDHPQAGQALTMIGQIHQANEAWEDALAAYRRVIGEFTDGQWVQEAKWAIAECTINLSQWRDAASAYQAYINAYGKDEAKVQEAKRRIEVLKDLARYQTLVDEKGQRKAFDAQYQIATIVRSQLANPVKAIIEYRKVAADWPDSHLADDALYEVGTTYLGLGETEKAREALLEAGRKYPSSPLADDALFMVGKSYEDEATKLAAASRGKAEALANEMAQRKAYQMAQSNRREQEVLRFKKVAGLKSAGKQVAAEVEEAFQAANYGQFNPANVELFARQADQEAEALTAAQLADRQDKINAALRKAVEAYSSASKVAGADKADDALLRVATIYDEELKDDQAALETWLEIVRQFSGTSVAEDASWRIAQYYERQRKYAEAIEAFKAFLRNYRASSRAAPAQFAIAENYEHLGEWVNAMDSYTNYINNFPDGPMAQKAREQINWIKTYRL